MNISSNGRSDHDLKVIRILICLKWILERSCFNHVCKRFRKSVTTKKATYKSVNDILSAHIDKLIVGGIFCDLDKAFDCVNHDISLSKLNFCGITGKANEWIRSCLGDRYQRVEVKVKNVNHNTF